MTFTYFKNFYGSFRVDVVILVFLHVDLKKPNKESVTLRMDVVNVILVFLYVDLKNLNTESVT